MHGRTQPKALLPFLRMPDETISSALSFSVAAEDAVNDTAFAPSAYCSPSDPN
jgi:hypothetical protein